MKIAYLHNTPPRSTYFKRRKIYCVREKYGQFGLQRRVMASVRSVQYSIYRQEFIEQFEKVIITDLI